MCSSCTHSAHINLCLLQFHCFLIIHCYRIALSFWERAQRASSHPKKGGGKTFPFLTLKLIKAADLWHLHLTLFSWQSPEAAWQFLPLRLIQRVLEERIIHPQHLVFPKGIPPVAPCCALGIKEDQIELSSLCRDFTMVCKPLFTQHTHIIFVYTFSKRQICDYFPLYIHEALPSFLCQTKAQ